MLSKNSFIFVTGHKGLVGSSLLRRLKFYGYKNIIIKTKKELDLRNQTKVSNFFKKNKIDAVINAAGKVGGILANNKYRADFIYDNISIQNNIIHSSFENNIRNLIFLGSSCIYPKNCKQPIKEKYILTGSLEKTNEPYAIAKIAGIKMCESYNRQYGKSHGLDYRCVMPSNLYGPGDNYDLKNSHVIPALIKKFHHAKKKKLPNVSIWGTGRPKREFLHVNDLARACIHVMNIKKNSFYKNLNPMSSHINVGSGEEITIKKLSELISKVVGYSGKIQFDLTKPDGTYSKLMNNTRIRNLGWKNEINLKDGLKHTYIDFIKNAK